MVASLTSEFVIGYLDDITLGGETDSVLEDFSRIELTAGAIGLSLNHAKCEVTCRDDEARSKFIKRGIHLKEVGREELTLLGAPLMPGPAVDGALIEKCTDLQTTSVRLLLLQLMIASF